MRLFFVVSKSRNTAKILDIFDVSTRMDEVPFEFDPGDPVRESLPPSLLSQPYDLFLEL